MSVRPDVLARCPVFAMLSEEDLGAFAQVSRTWAVEKGSYVFREGDPCEAMFLVVGGSVRVFKVAPDGRERTLHIVRPPHSFAEAAVFSDEGYPAFAAALAPTTLVVVPSLPFLRLLQERPAASLGLFRSLSQWAHRLLDELESESFLNARARVATWLLRELDRLPADDRRIRLQHSRKDIALQLGMAPETLSRIQGELEARGLVRAAPRHVEVLDRGGLHAVILTPS